MGVCDSLFKRKQQVRIGVVGNSITFGAGVPKNLSWPLLLHARLRQDHPNIHFVIGAVRASSADFASLCWDALWKQQGGSGAGHFDLILIDYSFTSSPSQEQALVSTVPRSPISPHACQRMPHVQGHTLGPFQPAACLLLR